jgi:uncharacterized phosphosugar-binding protein
MKNITMDTAEEALLGLIDKVEQTQTENINKAAQLCADAIAHDGVIHVFGSGHSVGFGMEMTGRPGSLVPVHLIRSTDFILNGIYTLKEFRDPVVNFERRPGIAEKLYDLYDIRPNDVFIVISNSGINGLVIDFAIRAKQDHKVIVVTSWEHTSSEPSRHPTGKKLYMMGDVVIDNCGPKGDAIIDTEGDGKLCSASAVTGDVIAQLLSIETARLLKQQGIEPPLLFEEQTEADKAHNQQLLAKYAGRI